jgi:hypothetical protein
MPRYKAAHIKEQGIDLIIIPLESSFGHIGASTQHAEIAELQSRANDAGLRGTVVPVWDSGEGRMAFIAPTQWHPYFDSLTLAFVAMNLNREIYW